MKSQFLRESFHFCTCEWHVVSYQLLRNAMSHKLWLECINHVLGRKSKDTKNLWVFWEVVSLLPWGNISYKTSCGISSSLELAGVNFAHTGHLATSYSMPQLIPGQKMSWQAMAMSKVTFMDRTEDVAALRHRDHYAITSKEQTDHEQDAVHFWCPNTGWCWVVSQLCVTTNHLG